MIRLLLLLILMAAVALGATWVADRPGTVEMEWLGWRLETSTFFLLIAFALVSVTLAVVWGVIAWLLDAPRKIARIRKNGRMKKGRELFTQAFLAAEGGDVPVAKKLTHQTQRYLDDTRLMTLLTARTAEASGDIAAAERAYVGLLNDMKAGLLARRGLSESAARRKDYAGAADHAAAALEMSKSAAWAFNTLLEHRLAAGDWKGALDALQDGEERKFIGGKAARRRRAVILAAAASHAERRGDRAQALELAQKSAALAPGFGPAAAMAARQFASASDLPNAERVVQAAWEVSPHPALGLLYADLRPSDSVADQAQRLLGLADLNPGHRESRFLRVEQRMAVGQWDAARNELEMLLQEGATSRLCSLMAAVAKGGGDDAAARDWLVLAATAPREPDWSDVEPDGLPFMFTDDDWARLVHVYGDSGQMIHPRYERYRPEALPTPSASLLPTVARISQYAEATADFGVYQGGTGGGDYVPRLAHVLEAEIADDMQDASEEVEADFDDEDDKKRSVLSWFRRG